MKAILKIILTVIIAIVFVSTFAYYLFFIQDNFTNVAPNQPSNFIPSNGKTFVSRTTQLRWTCSDPENDPLTYDVYFGLSNPPPKIVSNQTSTSYNPGILEFETRYYWKVVAHDNYNASTEGPVVEFTIAANQNPNTPSDPHPSDQAQDMPVSMDISWTGGDPDPEDTVTYDVYFGTINPPSKVSDNQSSTSYDPGTLNYATIYYWKIVSWDAQDASAQSPIWSFTTRSNQSGGGGTEQYPHTVFIEEGTASWCKDCPVVADILHELYDSGDYRFYYVSLVHDKNDKAKQRLNIDYNNTGFPTVYIDGGYEVIFSAGTPKAVFQEKISNTMVRSVPKLKLEVSAQWDNATKKIEITVLVINKESEQYTGHLKVYLTEQISQWYDLNGIPYRFSFLDYIVDKDVTVSAQGTTTVTEMYSASSLDPDNLMIMAVVSSKDSTQKYSDPPDNTHPFAAYFADATNATEVNTGKPHALPPLVGIEYPKKMRINIFGKSDRMTPLWKTKMNTWIIGKTAVKANVSSLDSTIEKVELYIDGELKDTITTTPYEWTFKKIDYLKHLFRKHTITVKAYADNGKTSSASIDVFAFFV
ncbi:MAG: Ig-like domain-containing protein [Euryarchaeota archaeon]|nr:Ig-like domain-containing protein [Euryarchaeota archaeon]